MTVIMRSTMCNEEKKQLITLIMNQGLLKIVGYFEKIVLKSYGLPLESQKTGHKII